MRIRIGYVTLYCTVLCCAGQIGTRQRIADVYDDATPKGTKLRKTQCQAQTQNQPSKMESNPHVSISIPLKRHQQVDNQCRPPFPRLAHKCVRNAREGMETFEKGGLGYVSNILYFFYIRLCIYQKVWLLPIISDPYQPTL